MQITFDNEEQKNRVLFSKCPYHFVQELERRCNKECYIIRGIDKPCSKCWEKFEDFIRLEVKNNE